MLRKMEKLRQSKILKDRKIEPFQLVVQPIDMPIVPIRQMSDEGWCHSFTLSYKPIDIKIIQWAIDEDLTIFLSMPGSKMRERSKWFKNDPDASEELAREEVQKLERLHKAKPGNAFWELFVEEDSAGYAYPQDILAQPPLTHSEAAKRFLNHLKQVMDKTKDYGTMPRAGCFGFASSCHYGAQAGLDMVLVERTNDDVEDHQTAISFARGASQQYGIKWGMDLSQWWGPVYGDGIEVSYFTRHCYLAYFAGASVVRIEVGKTLFTQGFRSLNEFGKSVKDFSLFTKREPDRGTPDVPMAFLLPTDHGWLTPPYWRTENTAWNYARVPYRPGDLQIDGLFGLSFPGSNFYQDPWPFGAYGPDNPTPPSPFALSHVPENFTPKGGNTYRSPQPLPFGRFFDRTDAQKAVEKGLDIRPYRPMGDTRWGDIIDVLLSNTSLEVLKYYKLVVLCGPIRVEGILKQRLIDYVKAGGILIVSAGQVGPEDSDLLGAKLEPEQRVGQAWVWGNNEHTKEPFRYLPSHSISADVLAKTPSKDPLVYRNFLGKGVIYTCTIPYMRGGVSPLADIATGLMDYVVNQVQPVRIKGLPVEWMSSRGRNFCNVVVANHSSIPWNGTVEVCKIDFSPSKVTELRGQQDIKMNQQGASVVFESSVPAYDINAYQIRKLE